ncbi:hypothetical protein HanXRQr2_Chr07g0300891 [Helianthus annuus]|uniref:Uncharacterized protein n=1 Tax=Helianthus annuus TaxID=4232 RepID=A0A9K3ILE4_HELAN|nr:hypothetical protein HanXRQr2_Chr07g0300891 [Helianthus annuus]KAJ0905196.1 hypothetical protein HanPSC8_Chr07g0291201 [Helianthus annuus]
MTFYSKVYLRDLHKVSVQILRCHQELKEECLYRSRFAQKMKRILQGLMIQLLQHNTSFLVLDLIPE